MRKTNIKSIVVAIFLTMIVTQNATMTYFEVPCIFQQDK